MMPRRLLWPTVLMALLGAAKPAPSPAEAFALGREKLEKLEKLGKTGPAVAKSWVQLAELAESHLMLPERDEALRKALEADPGHLPARTRLDEALREGAWMSVAEAERLNLEAWAAKGLVPYGSGALKPKEAEVQLAADRKKAGWPGMTLRLDGDRVVLYTDAGPAEAQRTFDILGKTAAAYLRFHTGTLKLDPVVKPVRAFLFKDRDSFVRFCAPIRQDGKVPASTAGFYDGNTRTLYLGTIENPASPAVEADQCLCVTVHEMVHAMDHACAGIIASGPMPVWLLEGRADHFGLGVLGRQPVPGWYNLCLNTGRIDDLGKAAGLDLAGLLATDAGAFKGEDRLARYAQAWAFVHFLFHAEGGRYAAAFRTFLKGLPSKCTQGDFEKAVGKVAVLEPAFQAYLRDVLLPAVKACPR